MAIINNHINAYVTSHIWYTLCYVKTPILDHIWLILYTTRQIFLIFWSSLWAWAATADIYIYIYICMFCDFIWISHISTNKTIKSWRRSALFMLTLVVVFDKPAIESRLLFLRHILLFWALRLALWVVRPYYQTVRIDRDIILTVWWRLEFGKTPTQFSFCDFTSFSLSLSIWKNHRE